jgi:hypothetical protein
VIVLDEGRPVDALFEVLTCHGFIVRREVSKVTVQVFQMNGERECGALTSMRPNLRNDAQMMFGALCNFVTTDR